MRFRAKRELSRPISEAVSRVIERLSFHLDPMRADSHLPCTHACGGCIHAACGCGDVSLNRVSGSWTGGTGTACASSTTAPSSAASGRTTAGCSPRRTRSSLACWGPASLAAWLARTPSSVRVKHQQSTQRPNAPPSTYSVAPFATLPFLAQHAPTASSPPAPPSQKRGRPHSTLSEPSCSPGSKRPPPAKTGLYRKPRPSHCTFYEAGDASLSSPTAHTHTHTRLTR